MPLRNRSTRGAAENRYETLSIDEICNLPVLQLAEENAHLHLWTTSSFLFEAKQVMDSWGFEYKTGLVWIKPNFGLGDYWRNAHEYLLLGVRGNLPFRHNGQKSWLQAKAGKHSQKPKQVRELVELVSPGPRLELFAREPNAGWTSFGNQLELPGNNVIDAFDSFDGLDEIDISALAHHVVNR